VAAIRRLKVFPQLPPPRPNPGEGANLRMIVLMRRAELRAGHREDGVWCDLRERQMEECGSPVRA